MSVGQISSRRSPRRVVVYDNARVALGATPCDETLGRRPSHCANRGIRAAIARFSNIAASKRAPTSWSEPLFPGGAYAGPICRYEEGWVGKGGSSTYRFRWSRCMKKQKDRKED